MTCANCNMPDTDGVLYQYDGLMICGRCARDEAYALRNELRKRFEKERQASVTTPRPRWSLLPDRATARVVELLTWAGDRKHSDEKSRDKPVEEHYDSLMRHLSAWRQGERLDSEHGMEHLAAVAVRALFMLEKELKGETK